MCINVKYFCRSGRLHRQTSCCMWKGNKMLLLCLLCWYSLSFPAAETHRWPRAHPVSRADELSLLAAVNLLEDIVSCYIKPNLFAFALRECWHYRDPAMKCFRRLLQFLLLLWFVFYWISPWTGFLWAWTNTGTGTKCQKVVGECYFRGYP